MKYLSLFSGIGGFELGIGKTHECIGFSEIDKYAIQIYNHTSHNTKTMEILQNLTQAPYPTLIYWLEDFLAKHLASQAREWGFLRQEEHSFLRSQGFSKKNDHAFYCLKTLKGFCLIKEGTLSLSSSKRLMSWGMTSNGKCLTVRISVSPRIGKECSLLDILEEHPDPKYFLSQEQVEKILSKSTDQPTLTTEYIERKG